MPRIRFIRGVIYNKEPCGPGQELEVPERDARIMCEGYGDAVRIDGEPHAPSAMTVEDEVVMRDPVAQHRDPAIKGSTRK